MTAAQSLPGIVNEDVFLRGVRDEAISSPKMLPARVKNEIAASLGDSLLAMTGEGLGLEVSTRSWDLAGAPRGLLRGLCGGKENPAMKRTKDTKEKA